MPRRAVPVLVWLAGVVVAVGLSLAAVGLVGDRVTDRQVPVVSAQQVQDELAGGAPLGTAAPQPDDTAPPGGGPAPADGPVTTTGPAGGATPSTTAVVAGPAAPSGGSPSAAPPSTASVPPAAGSPTTAAPPTTASPPSPAPVDEVYATSGGTVAVRCTGSAIALRFATPAAGFGIDGEPEAGPSQVDVRFRGDGGEVRVRARCEGGVPVEQIEER